VIGIKESAVLNNVFTFVNLTVITIVIIVGLTKIHGHNWNISPNEVDIHFFENFISDVFFILLGT
jgi:amino acid transporter